MLERKLPDADLKMMVDLPAGLDFNEWLASHSKFERLARSSAELPWPILTQIISSLTALALFEHVNLVYGTISEFCTTSGCADMTGPSNRCVSPAL